MKASKTLIVGWVGVCSTLLGACGAGDVSPHSGSRDFDDGSVGTGGATSGGTIDTATGGTVGADGSLPPEEEDVSTFRAPVATGRYLWSANPESGRVALIDGQTLAVEVLSAGLFPTYLAAVPGHEDPRAMVLNVGSSDASVFTLVEGVVNEQKVDTHTGANAWAVSESGHWAVAWSREDPDEALDPTDSLQEITVIDLTASDLEGQRLTVGFRPQLVHIDTADQRLSVVSEEGISVIELDGELEVDDWIQLGSGAGRDVSITEEGGYALVRRQGESSIEVIDLNDPSVVHELTLNGAITDLDLSASGRAVAVVRETSEMATFLMEDIAAGQSAVDTVQITGELFGSAALSEAGNAVALYTNAVDNDRVSIVDLAMGDGYLQHRTVNTKSPVQSMSASPDGHHAIALGSEGNTSGSFAVLSLVEERFPRIVGTEAPIEQVALGNDAALVTTSSPETHAAHLVELPELNVKARRLASAPLAAGILASEDLGYVAQRHPEGRITFFDFGTAEARTLTGFELAAEVVSE